MLSSANLDIDGALIFIAVMLFFGSGILFTLIAFIINSLQKKKQKWLVLLYFIFGEWIFYSFNQHCSTIYLNVLLE